jgi:thymidylate kinase
LEGIKASSAQDSQELRDTLDTKLDKQTFEEAKQGYDDLFDETIAKVNEIDARVSQVEERDHKLIVTEEDFKAFETPSSNAAHLET